MSSTTDKLGRAKAIIEADPKLKQTYESFKECMHYNETEALAATLGSRFDESADLLSGFGGNRG